ncbi:hypothetical protein I302_102337 [Kwoniella bestiolae CBS 10118]|uniref:Uncharacterized protein n=1 Tax=Kwoniella bestiolae CBS 10118 TaxID=1296100 RepID=A0A1B9GEN5_9TREE|nr:hypothetical protein I302_01030 [Kwoniella bestiolae CBS 10118]OCF29523.1 hypothetical protein I302_01030 [Kwoniella bestiolae CBS 10118]
MADQQSTTDSTFSKQDHSSKTGETSERSKSGTEMGSNSSEVDADAVDPTSRGTTPVQRSSRHNPNNKFVRLEPDSDNNDVETPVTYSSYTPKETAARLAALRASESDRSLVEKRPSTFSLQASSNGKKKKRGGRPALSEEEKAWKKEDRRIRNSLILS